MFMHTISRRRIGAALLAPAMLGIAFLLLAYPEAMATGISRGLAVCGEVIIPTLYPFTVLAGWVADSPLCRHPGRWVQALTRQLFGLPGCCGPAILLSLIGGYPAGALAIARLRRQGLINAEQASRMVLFCVGGGPGFIISTVGNGLLGNVGAGVCLYVAHITVSLAIGLWLGRRHHNVRAYTPKIHTESRPVAGLVADTCTALLTMCGFVLLASTALSLWEGIGLSLLAQEILGLPAAGVSAGVAAFLEVSCGCIALAGKGALAPVWLSLCISWGGLSVQGQVAAALPGEKVLTGRFWRWRLFHGLAAGGLSWGLFTWFPEAVSTSTGGTTALPFTVSPLASVMLLVLSFTAMLCFSGKKEEMH